MSFPNFIDISGFKYGLALRKSEKSLKRILHEDLNLNPYKMMVVQEPEENDWRSGKWKMFQLMLLCSPLMKLIFISLAMLTSRIFGAEPQIFLDNDLSTVSESLWFGSLFNGISYFVGYLKSNPPL